MDLRLKKIDMYILKRFMFTFFMLLIIFIGIVVIFDISEKIDDFVSNNAPIKEIIFNYYINFIPFFMNMFSPLFVFITVIFFTSRLAANSEIVAIMSCGISFHRFLVPYLVSAAIIALLSLSMNLYIIPSANVVRNKFELKYIKRRTLNDTDNIHYQISPGQFVYVESFSRWNNTAYGFTLENIKNNKLTSKLSAESAQWDSTFGGWKLNHYFIRNYIDGSFKDKIIAGSQLDTVINLNIADFYRNKESVENMTFGQLKEFIKTQKMRGDDDVKYSLIESYQRWALPFSAFILTIMGVALSSRKKRGGIGWNLTVGIALSFSYILFMKFSQMFVYTGTLPPFVAIWLPNFIFAIIAAYLYKIAPK